MTRRPSRACWRMSTPIQDDMSDEEALAALLKVQRQGPQEVYDRIAR